MAYDADATETGFSRFETDISDEANLLAIILRLASVINRPMKGGVADPQGLTLNELRTLMSLGSEGELAGHELSELIGMPPMNASRSFTALEKRGWIEPVEDPGNRRRRPYRLSAAGIEAYRAMIPQIAAVAEALLGGLTEAERRRFTKIVNKISARIADWTKTD